MLRRKELQNLQCKLKSEISFFLQDLVTIAWWEGVLLRREFAACVVYVEIATGENEALFSERFHTC